mgnify:CR=1 FL=1
MDNFKRSNYKRQKTVYQKLSEKVILRKFNISPYKDYDNLIDNIAAKITKRKV